MNIVQMNYIGLEQLQYLSDFLPCLHRIDDPERCQQIPTNTRTKIQMGYIGVGGIPYRIFPIF